MKREKATGCVMLASVAAFIGLLQGHVFAHCDTLDGPVIEDARQALEQGDVTPVLKWVAKEQEDEIQRAFQETLVVRAKSDEARQLADMYFFETLVRIHRAGEGEPYIGLKPGGSTEPGIMAADKALESGSSYEIVAQLSEAVRKGIRKRFAEVVEKKKHADDSVEAGREFVKAYVDYVHFVESVHNLVEEGSSHGHADAESATGRVHQAAAP